MWDSAIAFILCIVAVMIYMKVDAVKFSKCLDQYELMKYQNQQQARLIEDLRSDLTELKMKILMHKEQLDKGFTQVPAICENIKELQGKDAALESSLYNYRTAITADLREAQRKCELLTSKYTRIEQSLLNSRPPIEVTIMEQPKEKTFKRIRKQLDELQK